MWRYDESAPKAEQREVIRAELPGLGEAVNSAKTAMEARRAELLADPLYRKLVEDYQTVRSKRDTALSNLHHYRVTIGRDHGFAMVVMAQADNWQEAIDALKAKQ